MAVRTAKAKADKGGSSAKDSNPADEAERDRITRLTNTPHFRHGWLAAHIHAPIINDLREEHRPDMAAFANDILERAKAVETGDLAFLSRLLAAQALSLDAVFVETMRRSTLNMGEHLPAMETYARIALKAQAQSRATIEALAKLHQPKEQTVRHVHVNEGGQAVIAEEFHHHQHSAQGGSENAGSSGQPHATRTGPAGTGPALPGPDPIGNGMPLASRQGEAAMQDARGQGKRRT